ncbi:hypothetical protein, partial [Klebsiella pneumoniae]|uniref:hypothetical protein n=1 Tax=Klebsiella pneumoniae TaxID=573 RepID=UPI001CDB5AB3
IGGILITKGGGSYRNSLNHAMKSAVFSWYSGSRFADNFPVFTGEKLKSGDYSDTFAPFPPLCIFYTSALCR